MSSAFSLGIDFGTTNTVVALAGADGPAHLAKFPAPEGELFAFRSCLSFHAPPARPSDRVVAAGPWAIETYIEDPAETRFIQSFKSFAASKSFSETQILNRRYRFEDLLSAFLLKVRDYAGSELAELPSRVIVGRPVTFAGAAPSEPLALSRYETAFARMGFTEILYAYEPVGAAFFFARTLDRDATVLVGDFGGGTSEEPPVRNTRSMPSGPRPALASAASTAPSISASSGAIQPSNSLRATSRPMSMEPARNRNSAVSCADSASFSRETAR